MTEFADQHDPLADSQEPDDPFAEVPSEPIAEQEDPLAAPAPSDEFLEEPPEPDFEEGGGLLGDDDEGLPPGVQPGSLGGVNPSEETPVEDKEPEPEPDLGIEGFEEGEEAAMAAALDAKEGTDQEVLTAPQEGGQDNTQLESEQEAGAEEAEEEAALPEPEEPQPDPAPAPKSSNGNGKPKRKRRKKAKDHGPGRRAYTILSLGEDSKWSEEFEVVARSSDAALRQAYRKLSGNTEGEFTLVPVPSKYWNPETVKGKVPDAALAIKVG